MKQLMGDRRFETLYSEVAKAADRIAAIRKLADDEVVAAIAGASRGGDPLIANILATEALNRLHRATAIAREIGDGILATDAEFRVTFANPASEHLLGVSAHDIFGRPIHEVFHASPDMCARGPSGVCSLDHDLRRETSGSPIEATVSRRGEVPIPVLLTASSLSTGPGAGRIVLIRDVSEHVRSAALQAERIRLLEGSIQRSLDEIAERRRAQRRLRESEERLARIVDTVTEGIVLLDSAGQITFWNHAAEAITGRSSDEVLGRSYHDPEYVVEAADGGPSPLTAAYASLVGRGESVRAVELRFQTPDGATRVISADASRLAGAGGDAVVASFTDITSRKQAEEALQRLNKQLEARVQARTSELLALNRDLEAFAYTVSHDLRAPARGVEILSQAILDDHADQLDSEAKRQLGRVISEARRMRAIIGDLLKLARLATSEFRPQRVDVSAMTKEIMANLAESLPSRHVEVSVEAGLDVTGDPDLLRPLMENLLGNAWKYTRLAQTARISVGRAASSEGEDVIFVRDNGVGFDMSKADRLFQPFQRFHPASQFEGTGIGLATVRRIIERHGGRVWADARPDEGATFSFALPRRSSEG